VKQDCQVLIIGAGITGLMIARELVRRGADDILILEKEPGVGVHASGRNSGVLHAGLYYTSDTLTARFCIEGNRLLKAFCREKGLPVQETGKVIVAKGPSDIKRLHELKRRAEVGGTQAFLIDQQTLTEHEPYASTYECALFVPETAVIQPQAVLAALEKELADSGKVSLCYETAFVDVLGDRMIRTSRGTVRFEQLFNAAGAHAERIAHRFGLGLDYTILPMRGTYQRLISDRSYLVRGNIYPVPDLRTPFLGVHLTRSVEGEVYVGPTALPAWGREQYARWGGWNREAGAILIREAVLFFANPGFRAAALHVWRRILARSLLQEARQLVPAIRQTDLKQAEKVGIRPQLVHWPRKQLVMDFVVLTDGPTLHILNAISPAFTCSIPFARYAVSRLVTPSPAPPVVMLAGGGHRGETAVLGDDVVGRADSDDSSVVQEEGPGAGGPDQIEVM